MVTLIKGPSGIGKTTIFQAIAWCLYGMEKSVLPHNAVEKTTQTYVRIKFPFKKRILICERYKNSDYFAIKFGKEQYEDVTAQKLINQLFGTYDVWLCSCFVSQGNRNQITTNSNNSKFDILNKIAFSDESPQEIINNISEVLKIKTVEFKVTNQQLVNDMSKFKKKYNIKDKKNFTDIEFEKIISEIENKKSSLEQKKNLQYERDKLLPILRELEEQLKNLKEPLLEVTKDKQDLLSEIDHLKKQKIIYDHIQRLEKEFTTIHIVHFPDNDIFTMKDYKDTIEKENLIDINKKKCSEVDIEYSEKLVKNTIDKLKRELEFIEFYNLNKSILDLGEKINKLKNKKYKLIELPEIIENVIPTFVPKDVSDLKLQQEEIRNQIFVLKNELTMLENTRYICPHCDKKVFLTKSGLKPCFDEENTEVKEKKTKLTYFTKQNNDLTEQIKKILEDNKKKEKLHQIEVINEKNRIAKLKKRVLEIQTENAKEEKAKILDENQISQLENDVKLFSSWLSKYDHIHVSEFQNSTCNRILLTKKLKILETVVFTKPPLLSSEQILKRIQNQENSKKYQKIETELVNLRKSQDVTITQIKNLPSLENDLRKVDVYHEMKKVYDSQIFSLKRKIIEIQRKIPGEQISYIETMTLELEQLQKIYDDMIYSNYIMKKCNEFSSIRESLLEKEEEIVALEDLRKICEETECEVLMKVCTQINHKLSVICKEILPEFTLSLSLFKELKSKKSLKPQPHFFISKNGCKYSSLTQLSGGELDRVSLALTLAFSDFSNFPFIFFDESIASLDVDSKEISLQSIKNSTSNAIIFILHDTVEGIFDQIIEIKK